MSFWKKIFGGAKDEEAAAKPAAKPAAPASPAPPAPGDAEKAATTWLAAAVAEATKARPPAPLALAQHLAALVAAGHERLAIEWLDKLVVALRRHASAATAADELDLDAANRRAERGELAEMLPRLEALSARPAHAARAHFLLAEHHRRQGDPRTALHHYEAVLALDVAYPNARVRAEALRASLGAAAAAAPGVGDTISGVEGGAVKSARYQLVRQLGRGGAGVVYLARDVDLGRDVAVKLLHPHLAAAGSADARARFFDEARVAAALRHPGIIAVFDLDEAERRIVMEHAAGGTLRQRLAAGPLAPAEALDRHVELCAALAAAHARGVVHRDLKPANLLFRSTGPGAQLVLTDFGVAHLAGADRRGSEREPLGTLAYMAPEQRQGEAVPATDLWAAGVILYETLVGRLPWSQETLLAGRRDDQDLALPEAIAAALGALAGPVGAHLAALGAVDPAARPAIDEALASARHLVDELAFGAEEAAWAAERAAFAAAFPPRGK